MENNLKDEIKAGVKLQKISDDEIKAREADKKKRIEELKKVAEMMEKQGSGT